MNRLQTFIHGKGVINLNPRARMAKESEGEFSVADVSHPRKFRFEGGDHRAWTWAGIMSDEVEIMSDPARADVRDIIKLRVWFGRLNVLRLQDVFDQMGGFDRQLGLDEIGHGRLGTFCRTLRPPFSRLWHCCHSMEMNVLLFSSEAIAQLTQFVQT